MSANIDSAFGANIQLRDRIADACCTPELTQLFDDIASYVVVIAPSSALSISGRKRPADEEDRLSAKKAKLSNNEKPVSARWMSDGTTTFEASDVSFSLPVRKKLRLELVGTAEDGEMGGIRGVDVKTGSCEVALSWDRVDQVIMVPVPEKASPAFNFVVLPRPSPMNTTQNDPLIFSVSPKPPREVTFREPFENDTYELYIQRAFNSALSSRSVSNSVVAPIESEFESKMQQGRRKGERLWHVKAFKGSKEGYLYFLPTGVLWGFKKPVVFWRFEDVESVSYSSVLQRTFNLNVVGRKEVVGEDGVVREETEEWEFGMIDQVDFEGIDAYVKRHGLNDASLAESRRAKRYNVNAVKKEEGGEGDAVDSNAVDGETELEKAQRLERELQDAEDDEEEDYVVSGGESEGSGSESEEDDEGGGDGEEVGEDEEMDDEVGDEELDVEE